MIAESKKVRFYSLNEDGTKKDFLAELSLAQCKPSKLYSYIQPLQKILLNDNKKVLIEISIDKPLEITREEMEIKINEFIKKATS